MGRWRPLWDGEPGSVRSERSCRAFSPTGIAAAEARQSLRRLLAPDPLGSSTDFPSGKFRAWPGCSRGWGLGEPRTILLLAELLAGGRAKAPFHFLPLLLRLWYRGVVSDTSWEGALWEDGKRISLTEIISIVYFLS